MNLSGLSFCSGGNGATKMAVFSFLFHAHSELDRWIAKGGVFRVQALKSPGGGENGVLTSYWRFFTWGCDARFCGGPRGSCGCGDAKTPAGEGRISVYFWQLCSIFLLPGVCLCQYEIDVEPTRSMAQGGPRLGSVLAINSIAK